MKTIAMQNSVTWQIKKKIQENFFVIKFALTKKNTLGNVA